MDQVLLTPTIVNFRTELHPGSFSLHRKVIKCKLPGVYGRCGVAAHDMYSNVVGKS